MRLVSARVSKSPKECLSKEDVRLELDRIDRDLVTLFAERHTYVGRIADFKTDPHEAYDATRVAAVIKKVRETAAASGMDEDQAEMIWGALIEWNVNFEKGIIASRRNRD